MLIDFHAEATSEKLAMGYYLDGKISALWARTRSPHRRRAGSAERHGLSDRPRHDRSRDFRSGREAEQSIALFRGELKSRYEPAGGPCRLCGAVFTIDAKTRRCTGVERVMVD